MTDLGSVSGASYVIVKSSTLLDGLESDNMLAVPKRRSAECGA